MDMLAGGDRPQADLDMGKRNGEVDDDLDAGIGEQFASTLFAGMPNSPPRACRRVGIDVGERLDVEDREDAAPP